MVSRAFANHYVFTTTQPNLSLRLTLLLWLETNKKFQNVTTGTAEKNLKQKNYTSKNDFLLDFLELVKITAATTVKQQQ